MRSLSTIMPQDFAQEICKIMLEETGCSVSLIGEDGYIIASADHATIGKLHSVAKQMLEDGIPEIVLGEEDAASSREG